MQSEELSRLVRVVVFFRETISSIILLGRDDYSVILMGIYAHWKVNIIPLKRKLFQYGGFIRIYSYLITFYGYIIQLSVEISREFTEMHCDCYYITCIVI